MRKKHVPHEEHADESWLLPYSDLLTLLLALFIVMFAMSSVNKEKFDKLKEEFNSMFSSGSGVMEKDGKAIIPMQDIKKITTNKSQSDAKETKTISKEKMEEDKMYETEKMLENEISKEGYSDSVKIELDNEGLEISIQDVVLFNSGEAEVLYTVHPLLIKIAGMIRKLDNNIKIVGHTDNVPIYSQKFRSNWDLSAFRAINVMNFMTEKGYLDPRKMSIQACGEYNPKFDNSTEEGRSKNRRVEIYIIRKYPLPNNDKN